MSYKTFFIWILVSIYQGGVIMLMAIWLFENEFLHITSITFTALILNELLMIALEISTWHYFMVGAELLSIIIYILSIRFLKYDFGIDYVIFIIPLDVAFMTTFPFFWKVALITLITFLPLFVIKILKRFFAPPSYSKLV